MFKFKELKTLEKQLLRLNTPITRTRAHVTWNESTCNPNSGTCNIFTSKPLGQYRHSAITIHGSCAALIWQAWYTHMATHMAGVVHGVVASQLETRFGAPPDYVSKHLPFGILDDPAGGARKCSPSFGQDNVVSCALFYAQSFRRVSTLD